MLEVFVESVVGAFVWRFPGSIELLCSDLETFRIPQKPWPNPRPALVRLGEDRPGMPPFGEFLPVETVPADALFRIQCAPDGGVLWVEGERRLEFGIGRVVSVVQVVVGGEHVGDLPHGKGSYGILETWIDGPSPWVEGAPNPELRIPIWAPNSALQSAGVLDLDRGTLHIDGERFSFADPEPVVHKAIQWRDPALGARLLKRVRGVGTLYIDYNYNITSATLHADHLPILVGLDCSYLMDIDITAGELLPSDEVFGRLPPGVKAVVRGKEAVALACRLGQIGRVNGVFTASLTVDELALLADIGLDYVHVDSWPDVATLTAAMRGVGISPPNGSIGPNGCHFRRDQYDDHLRGVDWPTRIRLDVGELGLEPDPDAWTRLLKEVGPFVGGLQVFAKLEGALTSDMAMPHLERLKLSTCGLTDGDLAGLLAIVDSAPGLKVLDIEHNRFSAAGLARLPASLEVRSTGQKPAPPPEWSATGLDAEEVPGWVTAGMQSKWEGPDLDWAKLEPLIRAWLTRYSASMRQLLVAFDEPRNAAKAVTGLDKLDKALGAKGFKTLVKRAESATRNLKLRSPFSLPAQSVAAVLRELTSAVALLDVAWKLTAPEMLPALSDCDYDSTRRTYEPHWLLYLSGGAVRTAGFAQNWDSEFPPLTHGCPSERARQLEEVRRFLGPATVAQRRSHTDH